MINKIKVIRPLEDIENKIQEAVYLVEALNFRRNEIKISMPKYFPEILMRRLMHHNPYMDLKNMRYLGCEVIYNYANNIVVFHDDMPLYRLMYQTIELEKL